jgi:CheY-like chemotaxis protein
MTPRARDTYRVLVVDDDPSVLATYRRLLCRAGYLTVTVDDPCRALGPDGLDEGVDLLLIDYKMPSMDGLTLLAELRRRACHAPCILISAFLNEDIRGRADRLGVARVLEKPVDVSSLRRTIQELLPVSGARPVPCDGTGTEGVSRRER